MKVPVKLDTSNDCPHCQATAEGLDGVMRLRELQRDPEHTLQLMTDWLVLQLVALHDGDPVKAVAMVTEALNRHQADGLVQHHFQTLGVDPKLQTH